MNWHASPPTAQTSLSARQPVRSAARDYREDIQGMRALAVLSVVIYHAFPGVLPGGFTGVDVFFVISGYLITGILYREMAAQRFSLTSFYRRRVRRIFPALFLMLAGTATLGGLVLSPQDLQDLARNIITATLFASNIDFYLTSGYFDRAAELQPLLHTWSLAVEEQFYILFPLLLWLMLRFAPKLLVPLLVLSALASLAMSQWAVGKSPMGAYFLAPFRGFELLAGSLIAICPTPRLLSHEPLRTVLAGAGLLLIAGSMLLITKEMAFPGLLALPPVLGTSLVLIAGCGGANLGGRLISSPPFLFLGAISFSLYLWHWPLLSYLRIVSQPREPALILLLAAVALAVLLAWLSYRFAEQPVARIPQDCAAFLRWGLGGISVMTLAATTIMAAGGLPGRFPEASLRMFAGAADYSPLRSSCHRDARQLLPYDQTCVLGAPDTEPTLVVWGDSHGVELAKAAGEHLAASGLALRQVTASACPPVVNVDLATRPGCRVANDKLLAALSSDSSVSTVILLANAVSYFERQEAGPFIEGYRRVVEALSLAGKDVILVSQLPNIGMEAPAVAGYAVSNGRDPALIGRRRIEVEQELGRWRTLLFELAQDNHGVRFFDPLNALCGDVLCPVIDGGGNVLYFNATHVSLAGARKVVQDLKDKL